MTSWISPPIIFGVLIGGVSLSLWFPPAAPYFFIAFAAAAAIATLEAVLRSTGYDPVVTVIVYTIIAVANIAGAALYFLSK